VLSADNFTHVFGNLREILSGHESFSEDLRALLLNWNVSNGGLIGCELFLRIACYAAHSGVC